LRSDGRAVACGLNNSDQCTLPALDDGVTYVQVAGGQSHSLLLRSDGCVVACGDNNFGQCTLPALDDGVTYVQVAGGQCHSLLLRSDGRAVACGRNLFGECTLPNLEEGIVYSQVSAKTRHSLLLRSDGRAVACGANDDGQSTLPALEAGVTYVPDVSSQPDRVLQLEFSGPRDEDLHVVCHSLAGDVVHRLTARWLDAAVEVRRHLEMELRAGGHYGGRRLRFTLPDGRLLSDVGAGTAIGDLCGDGHEAKRRRVD